jgi:hypothetical protein
MNRGMLAIVVMLFLCWTAPLLAETPAGAATYRVTIVLYPGDAPTALRCVRRGSAQLPRGEAGPPAYDWTLKCSHVFNTLDARGAVSVTDPSSANTVPGGLQPTPDGRPTTSGGGSQRAATWPIPVKPSQIKPLKESATKVLKWLV